MRALWSTCISKPWYLVDREFSLFFLVLPSSSFNISVIIFVKYCNRRGYCYELEKSSSTNRNFGSVSLILFNIHGDSWCFSKFQFNGPGKLCFLNFFVNQSCFMLVFIMCSSILFETLVSVTYLWFLLDILILIKCNYDFVFFFMIVSVKPKYNQDSV